MSRNYSRSRHNSIVYKQKSLALETFTPLTEAALDDTSKMEILKQATAAVFSIQPTGYVKEVNDSTDHSLITQIINKANS